MTTTYNRRDLLKGGVALSAGCLTSPLALAADHKHRPHITGGNGPFQASWNSLRSITVPQWLRDGKFGIYTHSGHLFRSRSWQERHMVRPRHLHQPRFREHKASDCHLWAAGEVRL